MKNQLKHTQSNINVPSKEKEKLSLAKVFSYNLLYHDYTLMDF